ncbi:MAG: polyketide synthase, partial [Thermoguttaceae bacterium]
MNQELAERLKGMTPLARAVFALKETQARLEALERRQSAPIAIVGMACRFPGGASDPASYWRLICDGVDAIRQTPPDRWDADAFYDPDPAAPGKMTTRCGGFLEGIDEFDNHFFGISDREASRMDPQHRMLLELAWEALEDAGLPPGLLRGSRTGVFVGIAVSEYGMILNRDLSQADAAAATGGSLCLAANRLSFAFGWKGPSVALDTACSSSLVAVHMACQSVRNGECDAAVAGGTSLLLSPIASINLTKAGFCSSDGRVRAFDAAASGYVRSEGAGLVVLKPLAAALRDRDPIYAVVRGSAVNQTGASNGLTAPCRAAQEQVLRDAYARAQVSPARVQFVETQGTGTPLGDTIEALALGSVVGEGRPSESPCAIGSVKTNIGHMEAASGIASLMKTALALKHRQLPPNLHFKTPNPGIPFAQLRLRVQEKLEPWPDSAEPRLAGVSAFGFGGSNAHVVLEESTAAVADAPEVAGDGRRLCLLPISARTEKALDALGKRYGEFLRGDPPPWRDICYTAARRRDHHDCRLAVVAGSPQEAADLLEDFQRGQAPPGVFSGRKPYGRNLKIAFLFGGQAEHWKPCLPLANSALGFAAALEEIDAALKPIAGWSLASAL